MSNSEQTLKIDGADPFDDDLEQALDESGDELDVLLDELGRDSDPKEEESETLSEQNVGDGDFDDLVSLPELDDELDLSTGDEDEPPVVEQSEEFLTEPVEELQVEPDEPVVESTEKPMNSDPLAEVAAIAAERNAEAAKMAGGLGGRSVQLALAGVAILALVAAIFASWQAYSSASHVDELTATIQAMQQRAPVVAAPTPADDGALRADLEKLMVQVNEMAATLDGALVALREKNEATLVSLQARLDKLEKAKVTAPVSAITPLVEKAATFTATTTAAGGWSVNLISLSKEKEAEQELLRLRNLGIRAEQQRVEQDGRVWFRLRVPGFTSRDGAMAYVKTVEDKAGVKNAWVGKN